MREGWKLARRLAGTGRGPGKRRYQAPSARPPTRQEWRTFLSTPQGNYSCLAEENSSQFLFHEESRQPRSPFSLDLADKVFAACARIKRGRTPAPWGIPGTILKLIAMGRRGYEERRWDKSLKPEDQPPVRQPLHT